MQLISLYLMSKKYLEKKKGAYIVRSLMNELAIWFLKYLKKGVPL